MQRGTCGESEGASGGLTMSTAHAIGSAWSSNTRGGSGKPSLNNSERSALGRCWTSPWQHTVMQMRVPLWKALL